MIKTSLKLLSCLALSISLTSQLATANIVYDNSLSDNNVRFDTGLFEVGDEIILNNANRLGNPGATITNFISNITD